MRKSSLLLKLLGAFLLVTLISSLIISAYISNATQNAFDLYTTRSGQNQALRLSTSLAEFYSANNSWEGVGDWIRTLGYDSSMMGMMGNGNSHGRGQGQQNQNTTLKMMDQRVILADANGVVLFDSGEQLLSKQLTAKELSSGVDIYVDEKIVGNVIIAADSLLNSNSPAFEFLNSVKHSILISSVIAGIIALFIGGILFSQITFPIRQLKEASARIAAGELNKRVDIRSRDEFGDLGNSFNQMAENLGKAETARRNLVADIAHELRTPLTAIQGTLEGIQDEVLPLNMEQVNALYSETLLLNRLVSDLKLLSLADAGQLKLEKKLIQIGDLLQDVMDRFSNQMDQKQIHWAVNIEENLPPVQIDPDRLTQVINNLVSNALRYTPENGSIELECKYDRDKNNLAISIKDTGQGIQPEDLPHIFDRFYRADKSRARSSGGSGLGLAIVKQIIEAHGGSVQAFSPVLHTSSETGLGTEIFFTLPVETKRNQ